jgi:hypothetical protein
MLLHLLPALPAWRANFPHWQERAARFNATRVGQARIVEPARPHALAAQRANTASMKAARARLLVRAARLTRTVRPVLPRAPTRRPLAQQAPMRFPLHPVMFARRATTALLAVHFVPTRQPVAQQGRLRPLQLAAGVARFLALSKRTAWLARHPALFRQLRAQLGPTPELHPPAFFALRALLIQPLAGRHPPRVQPAQRESSAGAMRLCVPIAQLVSSTLVRAGIRQAPVSLVRLVRSTQPWAPPLPVRAFLARRALTAQATHHLV